MHRHWLLRVSNLDLSPRILGKVQKNIFFRLTIPQPKNDPCTCIHWQSHHLFYVYTSISDLLRVVSHNFGIYKLQFIVGHVTLSCNYTVKTLVSIPMAIYMYRNAYVNLFFQKLQRMKWCRHCFPSPLKMMTRWASMLETGSQCWIKQMTTGGRGKFMAALESFLETTCPLRHLTRLKERIKCDVQIYYNNL